MEPWQKVWREAIVPNLTRGHLVALRDALRENDPKLLQGVVAEPCSAYAAFNWLPCLGACALGYMVWKEGELDNVSDVFNAYAVLFSRIGLLGNDALLGYEFTQWYDLTPRDQVIRELLPEVLFALARI